MGGKDSLIDLWNFMGFSEKQQLMEQFRKINGNHYNKEDFAKFLADRYKGLHMTSKSIDEKQLDGHDPL